MTEIKSFIETRDELRRYIREHKMIPMLMTQAGIKARSTVYQAFAVNKKEELIGKKLEIWLAAVELVERAKNKVSLAQKALRK